MSSTRQRLTGFVAAVAVAAAIASPALADGDPASDYLITQPVFLPFNTKVDKAKAAELTALLAASKKAGFEIRVALIASRYDLGSVPILFRKPVQYAHFLGQELFYWYKGELLVVMPNGYGVYRRGGAPAADAAAVAAVAPPGTTSGNALADAATRIVRTLAGRRGIDLSHVTAAAPASSRRTDRIEIAAGVAAGLVVLAGLVFVRRRRASQ